MSFREDGYDDGLHSRPLRKPYELMGQAFSAGPWLAKYDEADQEYIDGYQEGNKALALGGSPTKNGHDKSRVKAALVICSRLVSLIRRSSPAS